MDLDARHPLGHGSRLIVRQADRGDADQDQLALEQVEFGRPGENVGGRDETRWIGSAEANAHASIRLGRDEEIVDPYALDTRGADAHDENRRSFVHAEPLDT